MCVLQKATTHSVAYGEAVRNARYIGHETKLLIFDIMRVSAHSDVTGDIKSIHERCFQSFKML